MGEESRTKKQRREHTRVESAGQYKKRPSLGKNHQAEIIDTTTVTNNKREKTSAVHIYTSKEQVGESGLKCIYTNADQLLNKIEDLKMLIADDVPDVIMITAVIPKAQKNPIPDTLLNIEGYKLFKNFEEVDSNLGVSGRRGVANYVINKYISNLCNKQIHKQFM